MSKHHPDWTVVVKIQFQLTFVAKSSKLKQSNIKKNMKDTYVLDNFPCKDDCPKFTLRNGVPSRTEFSISV